MSMNEATLCSSAEDFAPRATGGSVDVNLTGKVFPWSDGQPVMLAMPMSELFYLPVFDTPEELARVMDRAGAPYQSIKSIDDHSAFLFESALPSNVKVITNIRFTDTGTVRFRQIEVGR